MSSTPRTNDCSVTPRTETDVLLWTEAFLALGVPAVTAVVIRAQAGRFGILTVMEEDKHRGLSVIH